MGSFGNRRQPESGGGKFFDNRWKYTLRLNDGEAMNIRFACGADEPFQYLAHRVARSLDKHICAHPDPCPLCAAAQMLDARRASKLGIVKGRTSRSVYHVLSTRVVFKDVPVGDGKVRDIPAPKNAVGQYLKMENNVVIGTHPGQHPWAGQHDWKLEGLKLLDLTDFARAKQASEIDEIDARLSTRCQCNRAAPGEDGIPAYAQIECMGLKCAKCGREFQGDSADIMVTCQGCGHQGMPLEILRCTAGCGSPRRSGLSQCYVRMSRRGSGTDSTYSYEDLAPGPIAPDHMPFFFSSDGRPVRFDVKEIFKPRREALVQALTSVSMELRQVGLSVDQILQQCGTVQEPVAGGGGSFGGLPASTAGLPQVGVGMERRFQAPPAPAFPASSVPQNSGLPAATAQSGSAPLTGGGGLPPV